MILGNTLTFTWRNNKNYLYKGVNCKKNMSKLTFKFSLSLVNLNFKLKISLFLVFLI